MDIEALLQVLRFDPNTARATGWKKIGKRNNLGQQAFQKVYVPRPQYNDNPSVVTALYDDTKKRVVRYSEQTIGERIMKYTNLESHIAAIYTRKRGYLYRLICNHNIPLGSGSLTWDTLIRPERKIEPKKQGGSFLGKFFRLFHK